MSNEEVGDYFLTSKTILGDSSSWVGFSSYANQLHRQYSLSGFVLNILVVGEAGVGKVTLLKSLFSLSEADVNTKIAHEPSEHQKEAIGCHEEERAACLKFTEYSKSIEEFELSMTMNITVVDGFGDQVDNVDMLPRIIQRVHKGLEEYCSAESDIFRRFRGEIVDSRYHACIYLLPPWRTSLRKIDILAMSKLDKVINLIPVIGRAEILTLRELSLLKGRILKDISRFGIQLFYPTVDDRDEDFVQEEVKRLKSSIPFAVIGALLQHNNGSPQSAPLKCREYPWGKINIESDEYYDFLKFKQVLISDHSEELRRKATILYEIYRADILSKKPTSPPKKYNIRPITIS
ncbi:Cell division control protein 3 [Mitosporidium daphniae]